MIKINKIVHALASKDEIMVPSLVVPIDISNNWG